MYLVLQYATCCSLQTITDGQIYMGFDGCTARCGNYARICSAMFYLPLASYTISVGIRTVRDRAETSSRFIMAGLAVILFFRFVSSSSYHVTNSTVQLNSLS